MTKKKIGILHPGQMGVSIAASAVNSGYDVYWTSDGRSQATRTRAETQGLLDAHSLASLCEICDTIVCVCPPDAAEDVAQQVAACGFGGCYVDANAVAPERVQRIERALQAVGATCVDGSIIGPPAWEPNTTWLYLSGADAGQVAALFESGPVQPVVIGDVVGQASGLKMCYAAYTKGSTALLTAVQGAAEALGISDVLREQWRLEGSGLDVDAPARARRVTAKAWRFAGEMDEIAATFEGAGMPGGFHLAAGDIYRRLARFKDAAETPSLDDVLSALMDDNSDS